MNIPLTKGKYAVVDLWVYDDLLKLSKTWRWQQGFAVASIGLIPHVPMHRLIMELAGYRIFGYAIKHRDRDNLNNQLGNLYRVPTNSRTFKTYLPEGYEQIDFPKTRPASLPEGPPPSPTGVPRLAATGRILLHCGRGSTPPDRW